ncbi:MAG: HAD-IIIA family hydrolase [Planctomycetes bacterium]|nr:HAD-IIIA family hydrolase [Planctomycetota bacterium]MBI3848253.1 HAD-IIIA family hydrolase [Planctomycetota bacterium]
MADRRTTKRVDSSRLRRVSLLVLDVDGVLTDGRVQFDSTGKETKVFHVHDGAGIAYFRKCGGRVALLSGRSSDVVKERARELGIEDCLQGFMQKTSPYEALLTKHGLTDEAVCYVGDDLTDLPLLRRVGFPVAPRNARTEVRRVAAYVTRACGGDGAVREVVELLLRSQGKWQTMVERAGI